MSEELTIEAAAIEAAEQQRARRAAFVKDLREFADFLEQNEAAPHNDYLNVFIPMQTADAFRNAARRLGFTAKKFEGQWASVVRKFGSVQYEVFIARDQVCTKTVVGKTIVPAHEEEIVEWSCSESLLKGDGQ